MPYSRVFVHFVWSTKNRIPFLNSAALRQKVWNHMKSNATAKGIIIDAVNGYEDHCHCLIAFGRDQMISRTMQLLKGESAYWINKHRLCQGKFEWQDEYFAISVSESVLPRLRNYIRKQELHHAKKTFQHEYDELMSRHKFKEQLSSTG